MEFPLPTQLVLRTSTMMTFDDSLLLPSDREALGPDCSTKRARQYLTGRSLARTAIRALGLSPDHSLLRAPSGAVQWPQAVVGSIAHSGERVVAMVGRSSEYVSVGVDVECVTRMRRPEIAARILTPNERALMDGVSAEEKNRRLLTIFSAKESLFKLLNPITGVFFGFQDAECVALLESKSLELVLLRNLTPAYQTGFRVVVQLGFIDEFVVSACWVKRGG